MFFSNWHAMLRVGIVTLAAYAALLVLLRVSGKRTLSKMNAFDLVVTVALGSTLATVALSKETALAEGLLAFAMLIFLQFAVAWLSVRSSLFGAMVKARPRLLFYRDEFLRDAMRAERVTEGEVLAAIREQGVPALDAVEAVVLETAGTFAVLQRRDGQAPTALRQVTGAPQVLGDAASAD